ncbi:P-loop containing nucleoside triphosphate hydrolase protein [Xylaria cubensis]|nr:P-loop containing nucleoside triphosphate hydrolase protein [Xylaria cubensis]
MSTSNHVGDLRADGRSNVHIGNRNIVVQAPERPETPPKPSSFIPFCRDSHFIERKTILDRIKQACSSSPSRAALVGLGGVGKSQLAIEYAYRVRDSFRREKKELWVFWIHAGTRARVEQGFKAIADAIKILGRNQPDADILQLVYQWLCNEHNGQWLMVLDSADDIDVFYDVSQDGKQSTPTGEEMKALWAYLPQSSNGSIIITTRNKDLAFRLTGHHSHVIDVGPMDHTDALALLKTKSGPQFDEVSGIELVEALGHMPLAIGQAAAYIQQRAPRTSVKKYLKEFRQNEQKQLSLLNYDGGDLRRDVNASNSVIATWQISFEHIRSQRPTATELLSLMSFFDCQAIQEELVQPIPSNENGNLETHSDDESTSTSESSNNASEDDTYYEEFEEDIATLQNYCLISTNEIGDTFEMHGLVQLSTRKWLDMHKETEKFEMKYISRLARGFPVLKLSNLPAYRKLSPHVEQAVLYYPKNKELKHLDNFINILHLGGLYSIQQGRYATSEGMLEKALAVAKELFGTEYVKTAEVMHSLGTAYCHQMRWKDAEEMFRETINIYEAVLEPDHAKTLESIQNLAQVYIGQGRLDAAELELTQIVEKEKMVLGLEHCNTMISMHSLASVYSEQKRWQEAELLFKEVLERKKKVLGLEHPYTLSSMYSLASVYSEQKRWQEAELLFKEVLERKKKVLGLEHPYTLSSMHSLALAYIGQEWWQEAEVLLIEVVERRKKVLGLEHPDTLRSMHNLASVYNGQERWQEAEILLIEVVEREKKVRGPEHPDTLMSMAGLAHARKGLGHEDEAMELMEQCAQARSRVLGCEHPHTQRSLSWLQYWRAEKSQALERSSRPIVKNRMALITAKFRKLGFRRGRYDDSAGPSGQT